MRKARVNPFAMHAVESVPFRFLSGTWESHLRQLEGKKFRAAVVGPEGSGKTTLLLELQERLHQIGRATFFQVISQDKFLRQEQFHELTVRLRQSDAVCLIDGSERLTWIQRQWLYSRLSTGPLVVAVHKSCGLPTWYRCYTDFELMKYVLDRLFQQPSKPLIDLSEKRFHEAGGNIRVALRMLYEDWHEARINDVATTGLRTGQSLSV